MKEGKYSSPVIKDEYTGAKKLEKNVRFNQHPKRKNNFVVAAMYAAYQQGKSLEEIGGMYHKTRQCIYDLFRSRGYKLRSKQFLGLQILDGISFTLMKRKYLRGSIEGKRVLMHQYVWRKERGDIPEGFVIYHVDGNSQNNKVENLKLIARKDMSKTFNPFHFNQFTKQHDLQS